MPIFLPVNSTEIKFQILDSDDDPCFAVELTGCLSSQGNQRNSVGIIT